MPTHGSLNPDVEGSFEVTLARGLNRTHEYLPIQTAFAWFKRRFLYLADHKQRQELAAALQWEYRRCSFWVKGDTRVLQRLGEQYSDAQCLVTPTHRFPFEILMDIFHIVWDDHSSPARVILVCRR